MEQPQPNGHKRKKRQVWQDCPYCGLEVKGKMGLGIHYGFATKDERAAQHPVIYDKTKHEWKENQPASAPQTIPTP